MLRPVIKQMLYFCRMRYKFYSLFLLIVIGMQLNAQEKWDLRKCVDYALANNISIKQTDLQAKLAKINAYQNKLSQYPSASFSTGGSYNSGRNQDPTSFTLITQSYLSANMQLQSSAEIFNWYSKKNNIAASNWDLQAAIASSEKLRDDIALAVANVYLQILLSKEQEKIAEVQLQQSQSQLSNTRKLVNAGSLPELNAAELEAQVATDSATYINAKGNTAQNILNLKAYMALDASAPFEIDVPPVEKIPLEDIASLQPDAVYASAIAHLPQQRVNDFKIKSAERTSAAAKANMYPTISAFGSLGSGYANYFNFPNYTNVVSGTSPTSLQVTVGGTPYTVFGPTVTQVKSGTIKSDAYFTQLNRNFRQSIGLNINVPIFNGGSLRSAYERSKVTIENLQLQQQADNQKLKQDIYQAYNSATVALEKFNAGKKAVEAAERSFGFSQKRYAVGMLTTFELITNQNNLFRAKLQNALDQYDYVFKMKVLEFYKGLGLKL
jgi:outer membrane protein